MEEIKARKYNKVIPIYCMHDKEDYLSKIEKIVKKFHSWNRVAVSKKYDRLKVGGWIHVGQIVIAGLQTVYWNLGQTAGALVWLCSDGALITLPKKMFFFLSNPLNNDTSKKNQNKHKCTFWILKSTNIHRSTNMESWWNQLRFIIFLN